MPTIHLNPKKIVRSIYAIPFNVEDSGSGLSLDISYITPNLLVCSYPVTKYPKLLYRNGLHEIVAYLNEVHGKGTWKIYNFKIEKNGSDYDDIDLKNAADRALYFPNYQSADGLPLPSQNSVVSVKDLICRKGWLDHSPPPFTLLQEILDDMNEHIMKSGNNVVILHCRMGKGRSGTICIAYMMKYMNFPFEEAKELFMEKRFRSGLSKGVTIFSQIRYIRYHELALYYGINENKLILEQLKMARFRLESIQLQNLTTVFYQHPYITCVKILKYNSNRDGLIDLVALQTPEQPHQHILRNKKSVSIGINQDLDICDIKIEFSLITKSNSFSNKLTTLASNSNCWLNLYWETVKCSKTGSTNNFMLNDLKLEQDNGLKFLFIIRWEELDGTSGTRSKGLKLFSSCALKWSLV
ncbi:putative phosphatidylinositol 3,4,5-trisphosphate 3-phosphatase TEP1 [Nakaseomyces bracarensis]|uniref:phosphatidylinositol-3,4,5-trisphosphate 3-phosphatase n=1 Tax=Nakaseomyces bracarensis TaxID=273131 RepID=A0ABR4NUR4_9SACH